jgi:HEPN domain-containing protein
MRPLTREWVRKAEGDFAMMEREGRVRRNPVYDGICFHAQQCAEKYLKARLQEAAHPFTKTHDLLGLLQALLPIEPALASLRPALRVLNRYAVAFRYPGITASRVQARAAVVHCRKVRAALRHTLGLRN